MIAPHDNRRWPAWSIWVWVASGLMHLAVLLIFAYVGTTTTLNLLRWAFTH